jgi:hypothetical protein
MTSVKRSPLDPEPHGRFRVNAWKSQAELLWGGDGLGLYQGRVPLSGDDIDEVIRKLTLAKERLCAPSSAT